MAEFVYVYGNHIKPDGTRTDRIYVFKLSDKEQAIPKHGDIVHCKGFDNGAGTGRDDLYVLHTKETDKRKEWVVGICYTGDGK